jgi:hypothetical protein
MMEAKRRSPPSFIYVYLCLSMSCLSRGSDLSMFYLCLSMFY